MTEHRGSLPPPAADLHIPSNEGASDASERAHGTRRGPWRWLVAAVATALLVVSGSGLVAFAQTGGGPGVGPSFLPAGTPVYFEIRADLPAGQRETLAQMLARFPGFADVASFDMKVDAALDQALSSSMQALSWTQDIKPWFGGDIAFGVLELTRDSVESGDPAVLAGVSVTDRAAFEAFVAEAMGDGMELQEEDHQGGTIVGDEQGAYGITDELLLIGSSTNEVRLGLDILAGESPSLAADSEFQTAFARVPDARLGAGYIDIQALRPFIEASMEESGTTDVTALALLPEDLTWYAASRPDGATFEAFLTPATGSPVMTPGESALAERFPAGTQVYFEARALGTSIGTALSALSAQMGEDVEDLDQIGAFLGSPDTGLGELLAWADDVALGAALEGEAWLGLGVEVTDQDAAEDLVTSLLGFARMLAVQQESGITVSDDIVGGVTVTTIRVDDEEMAEELPIPVDTSLSVALGEGVLLIGTGDFVVRGLEMDADTSLAGSAGYRDALVSVGTPNVGFLYANVAGVREGLEPMLPFMVDDYDEIRPFLEPFDRLAAASSVTEEGVLTTTVMLFLR
jgi:hypothetical protein